jgi:serine phosphatase RsbU (regulator of sigma subunit)/HAMP domain-containing protein
VKLRFTISRKIGTGFGLFILAVGVVFYFTNRTLTQSRQINQQINEVYAPSVKELEQLENWIVRAHQLMKTWATIQRREDDLDHLEAVDLCEHNIPEQVKKIKAYSQNWGPEERQKLANLSDLLVRLLSSYSEIRAVLPTFDSYADPMNSMLAEEYFLSGGDLEETYDEARRSLMVLTRIQRESMSEKIESMNSAFDTLNKLLVNIAIVVILSGIILAYLTSQSIIRPVNSLKRKLQNLSLGIYSVHETKTGNDEIGDMAGAVHTLISNFERTKEFASSVGAGNFSISYEPLSAHDEMGMSLIRMKDELASYRNDMELKVEQQTIEIRLQKDAVQAQNEKITELYDDLQSSIDYAKRLQETILPNNELIQSMFPENFVLFRPKATVSGDFYWFKQKGNKKIFAAADCTGHGVPGAFMSLVGHNVLNQATKVYSSPAQILNSASRLAGEVMRANSGEHYMKDGMDIALCTFDEELMELEFSGAHNPVYIIRDNEVISLDSNPYSIGTYVNGEKEYSNHSMKTKVGDCVYLFSDGFVDQFGGPKNKKFMRKNFKQMLLNVAHLPMPEQKLRIIETLDEWIGDQDQIDDILLIGVRIGANK